MKAPLLHTVLLVNMINASTFMDAPKDLVSVKKIITHVPVNAILEAAIDVNGDGHFDNPF